MQTQILFIIIFLSQIFLLSFYLPGKLRKRVSYIFDNYPPAEYPKLYPKSIDYYKLLLNIFRGINLLILGAGLLLLVALFVNFPGDSNPERWDQAVVNAWFVIQIFPMILLEISAFKYFKSMRKANSRATRKAALQPRRLFDFVSPAMIGLAILVYIAFVAFIHYMRQFDYPWFGGYINVAILTAVNLFFAGIAIWNMYGKKINPHQAHEDRINEIGFTLKTLVLVSIAMTIYGAISIVLHAYDLRHLNSTIMSLYFQLLGLISIGTAFRTFRIEDINFEVYKDEPAAALATK